MTLGLTALGELVDRYVALFGPLSGRRDVVLREWQRQLGDLDLAQLHRALDVLGRQHEGHTRPRLATIRAEALNTRGEPSPTGRGSEWCGQCKAHYWYAGFEINGVVHPRLRCRCRTAGANWTTEAALSWSEDDARLLREGYAPALVLL